MKYKCEKCGNEGKMKNPISVKGGRASVPLSKDGQAKMESGKAKYWEAWRKRHGKTKVIRNRPKKDVF